MVANSQQKFEEQFTKYVQHDKGNPLEAINFI